MKKRSQLSRLKPSEKHSQGIPILFEITQCEKLTAVLPVKLYPSLKKWALSKGGSTFVRSLIQKEKVLEEELADKTPWRR